MKSTAETRTTAFDFRQRIGMEVLMDIRITTR
jgi:hypothetical protein